MTRLFLAVWLTVFSVALALPPVMVMAQADDGADDDGDDDGDDGDGDGPYDGGGDVSQIEVWCTTEASAYYCLPYHTYYCQQGYAVACRMMQLGQHCYGGDPNTCNYYVGILQANRDCQFGNPQACNWLRQQGL
jgi:hypothetical protein